MSNYDISLLPENAREQDLPVFFSANSEVHGGSSSAGTSVLTALAFRWWRSWNEAESLFWRHDSDCKRKRFYLMKSGRSWKFIFFGRKFSNWIFRSCFFLLARNMDIPGLCDKEYRERICSKMSLFSCFRHFSAVFFDSFCLRLQPFSMFLGSANGSRPTSCNGATHQTGETHIET